MPTYDYKCPEGHTEERVHSMEFDGKVICTECGRVSEKQLSAPGVYVRGGTPTHHKRKAQSRKPGTPVEPIDLGEIG